MRMMMTATALLIAAPAIAQKAPPAAASTAAAPSPTPPPPVATLVVKPIPPTDPARLAAARPVIDKLWPVGSYARLMHVIMGPVMQDSMARSFAMKPDDIMPGLSAMTAGSGADKAGGGDQTLGQMAAAKDPYFQQRVTLTMAAVGDELATLMTQVEPDIRDAMAHAYARRFTVAELGELDRFLATPTGRAYAADAYTLMMSPDMTQAMQGFLPRMVKAAPEMMARVMAATKDLPPVPSGSKSTPPVVVVPKRTP